MADGFDFEARFEARLRARAALASRPYSALAIAHEAVAAGSRRRWIGLLERPSRPRGYTWVIVAVLLAIALLGAVTLVGALLRVPRPTAPSVVTKGSIVVSANPWDFGGGENGDIYLLSADAPPRRVIGSDGDGVAQACPAFSPDGQKLAYGEARASGPVTTYRGVWPVPNRAVVIVGLDANGDPSSPITRVTVLTDPGEIMCPQWSPDGTQVAFRLGSDLWVADATSGKTTLFAVEAAPWGQQGFAWSRDGSRIAVAGPGQIRVVPIDGRPSTVISVKGATPGSFTGSMGWTAGDDGIVYDGTDAQGDVLSVNRVDADGTHDIQLAAGGGAVVSPDGTRVAYFSDALHILAVSDSSGAHVVDVPIPADFLLEALVWSPDGKRLLLSSIDGVVSVAVAPDSSTPIVYATGQSGSPMGLNLEWSSSEVTWQPVLP